MASNLKEAPAVAVARIETERTSLLTRLAEVDARRGVLKARLSQTLPHFEYKRLKDEDEDLKTELGGINREMAMLNAERKKHQFVSVPAADRPPDFDKRRTAALFAVAEAAFDLSYGDGDEETLGNALDAAFDRLDGVCPEWSRAGGGR